MLHKKSLKGLINRIYLDVFFKLIGQHLNYGGDDRDRTDGLYVANVPLSQLSYIPTQIIKSQENTLKEIV